MRVARGVATLGLAVLLQGCTINWRSIHIDKLQPVAEPIPVRATVTVKSWRVDFDSSSNSYHTVDEPALVATVEREVSQSLEASRLFTIVDKTEPSDLDIEVQLSANVHPSPALTAWGAFCGLLILTPWLLGAPMGWTPFVVDGVFVLRDRSGRMIGKHVAHFERTHYLGAYYGHDTLSNPFHYDMAQLLKSFVDFAGRERKKIATASDGSIAPPGRPPPPGEPARSRTRALALVIGIERYHGELPAATGAAADARAVAELAESVLGVPRANIHLLVDADASKASITAEVDEWLVRNASSGDNVYFYFAGHGSPDPSGAKRYLVPWDGDPKFIVSKGVAVEPLLQKLGTLKAAHVYAFLDACFSGTGGRSVVTPGTRPVFVERRAPRVETRRPIAVFAATGPNETTGAGPRGGGLFTHFLLEGLRGAADKNRDGSVNVGELGDYLHDRVADEARRQNRDQHPETSSAPSMRNAPLVRH